MLDPNRRSGEYEAVVPGWAAVLEGGMIRVAAEGADADAPAIEHDVLKIRCHPK
jgi:hypothetical protein